MTFCISFYGWQLKQICSHATILILETNSEQIQGWHNMLLCLPLLNLCKLGLAKRAKSNIKKKIMSLDSNNCFFMRLVATTWRGGRCILQCFFRASALPFILDKSLSLYSHLRQEIADFKSRKSHFLWPRPAPLAKGLASLAVDQTASDFQNLFNISSVWHAFDNRLKHPPSPPFPSLSLSFSLLLPPSSACFRVHRFGETKDFLRYLTAPHILPAPLTNFWINRAFESTSYREREREREREKKMPGFKKVDCVW